MAKNSVTCVAVHTHTHTQTTSYVTKIDKVGGVAICY